MAADYNYEQEREKMAALREKNQRLLDKKKALLIKLQEGEKLKINLKETRKDAKKLASQREKLRAALGDRGGVSDEETEEREKPPDTFTSTAKEKPEYARELNGDSELYRYTVASSHQSGVTSGDVNELDLRTEYQVLRAKNEILIQEKRKLEDHNASLIQELAALNMKYEGQRRCAEQLESENQRLSQIISQQQEAQHTNISSQQEDVLLLKEQVKIYQEDFNSERAEREKIHSEKLALQEQVEKANITVEALQNQIRELVARSSQSQVEPMLPRGPARAPYTVSPYDTRPLAPSQDTERGYGRRYDVDPSGYPNHQPYAERFPVRTTNNDVIRRGGYTGRPRAFLSPDMTAVVDEVIDHSESTPKTI